MRSLLFLLLTAALVQAQSFGVGTAEFDYARSWPFGFSGHYFAQTDLEPDQLAPGGAAVAAAVQSDSLGNQSLNGFTLVMDADSTSDALIIQAKANGAFTTGVQNNLASTSFLYVHRATDFTMPDSVALDSLNEDNALEFLSYITAEHKIAGTLNQLNIVSLDATQCVFQFSAQGVDVDDWLFYVSVTNGEFNTLAVPLDPVLQISQPLPGELRLDWSAMPNASSYRVYQAADSASPWTLLTQTSDLFLGLGVVEPPAMQLYHVRSVYELPVD